MSNRFRVLRTPIYLSPKKTEKIVVACTTLHNLLRNKTSEYYHPDAIDREYEENCTIQPGKWQEETTMVPLERSKNRNPSTESRKIREQLTEYFNNEGQVPWQRSMAGL